MNIGTYLDAAIGIGIGIFLICVKSKNPGDKKDAFRRFAGIIVIITTILLLLISWLSKG